MTLWSDAFPWRPCVSCEPPYGMGECGCTPSGRYVLAASLALPVLLPFLLCFPPPFFVQQNVSVGEVSIAGVIPQSLQLLAQVTFASLG